MRLFSWLSKLFRPIVEECDDPILGRINRVNNGDWNGAVPIEHSLTRIKLLEFHIESECLPTDQQRALLVEFRDRYESLWPDIVAALAAYHPHLKTIEAVAQHILGPFLYLHLDLPVDGEPQRWSLNYFFDHPDEGDMMYHVDFSEWAIEDVWGSD
jgi:hypothetical protein